MKRIGALASRISPRNLLIYNIAVIVLSCAIALLVLIISGALIVAGLGVIALVTRTPSLMDLSAPGFSLAALCLLCLAVLTAILNLYAIGINIKITK